MNPNGQSLLSGPAVSALVRRGLSPQLLTGSPIQSQVTPQSPNYNPSMTTPGQPPMPDKSPMSGIHPNDLGQAGPQQGFVPTDEAGIIVKALHDRLKHHTKMQEHFVRTLLPQEDKKKSLNEIEHDISKYAFLHGDMEAEKSLQSTGERMHGESDIANFEDAYHAGDMKLAIEIAKQSNDPGLKAMAANLMNRGKEENPEEEFKLSTHSPLNIMP